MRSAAGDAGCEREDAILGAAGLDARQRSRPSARSPRARAATRAIQVGEAGVAANDGTLEVRFTLPGGAYATAVMREMMKT